MHERLLKALARSDRVGSFYRRISTREPDHELLYAKRLKELKFIELLMIGAIEMGKTHCETRCRNLSAYSLVFLEEEGFVVDVETRTSHIRAKREGESEDYYIIRWD
jgi:hypothetical protein